MLGYHAVNSHQDLAMQMTPRFETKREMGTSVY